MYTSFVASIGTNFSIDPEENLKDSILKQYERVIIESLITSFGLDFIVKDRHGGDVDTILNVRKIGTDPQMEYKNPKNKSNYENRGEYDSKKVHSDNRYITKNREISSLKKEGALKDAYTGKKIQPTDSYDLDHVISAKEIHDDRGRVLANLKGTDLANSPENLKPTNPSLNRSKKADRMKDFLNRTDDKYTDGDENRKENMLRIDKEARDSYESKLTTAYYTSKDFAKDVSIAAGTVGLQMGLRQALGFVFTEIWFSVKEEFEKADKSSDFDLKQFLNNIADGIKRGAENAKKKYHELFAKFKEGTLSGILASVTTTLCNIFFTTAKNTVRIIRQSYASLVQAGKILFFNPENYLFGDRICAVMKIISTGASIVLGTIVSETISKTYAGTLPVIGDILQNFCGALATGLLSCTFLYYFDNSPLIKQLTRNLNALPTISKDVDYFVKQAEYFELLAAEIMKLDIEKFKEETQAYQYYAHKIETAQSEEELNEILRSYYSNFDLILPWDGDFDAFMANKNNSLRYE